MTYLTRANATLAYLALVLLLGGASAAGFSGNLLLQLLGAGLIAWTLINRREGGLLVTGLRPFGVAVAVLIAVQFVPLPPGLWKLLPGRETVHAGFGLLGVEAPWLTLSLAPWEALGSFTWWIPALSLFVAMRAEDAPSARQTIWVIGAVAAVSTVIGGIQRGVGSAYFYTVTNYGAGPGFFANSNHQGSFLLCALVLWGGWMLDYRASQRRPGPWFSGLSAVLLGVAVLLLFGVLLSGSLACLALLVPVLAALLLMSRPDWRLPVPLVLLLILTALAGFAGFLLFGPVANDLTAKGVVAGISRQEFLVTGSRLAADFAPLGSGTGTFLDLYRWYENPSVVGTTFVNHAHNDLLELLIETGVFGLAAVGTFLAWYVPRAWRLWSGERGPVTALAASVVIGVELAHSLVDYPLRTAAMSSLVAVACVLLVRGPEAVRSRREARRENDVEPASRMIRI